MPPKIAIDARHLYSGIGSYISQLVTHLQSTPRDFELVLVTVPENRRKAEALGCDDVRLIPDGIYSLRAQISLPPAIADCDLFHCTHYNVPLLRRKPVIVTIHDLIHLDRRFVRHTGVWMYGSAMLRMATRRADHLITVSEFTKRELERRLHVQPSRVTTIYNGVSPVFLAREHAPAERAARDLTGIARPYILYVGNLAIHKNVGGLLRAVAHLQHRLADFELLIIGDPRNAMIDLEGEIRELGIGARVRLVPHVPLDALPAIYGGAQVFVLPSFVEGFGIPVLEAMACGTPVVCSRSASLPEVGGDAAEYFDPNDPHDLAAKLELVLTSGERRDVMRARGLDQAARFSWKASAERHVAAYRRLLDTRLPATAR